MVSRAAGRSTASVWRIPSLYRPRCLVRRGRSILQVPFLKIRSMDLPRRTKHRGRYKEGIRQTDAVERPPARETIHESGISACSLAQNVPGGKRCKCARTDKELVIEGRVVQKAVRGRAGENIVEDTDSAANHGVGTGTARAPGEAKPRF